MTNTRPVPNTSSKLVDGAGYLVSPWIQFFQQFVQKAAAVVNVTVGASPFDYTPNQNGTIWIRGGTVSQIFLIRGDTSILVANSSAPTVQVPISVGDTVRTVYSVKPTNYQFLGSA